MAVVLVTGGSRGIGRAVVEAFTAQGHAVAFTYAAHAEAAQSVVDAVSARGGRAAAFQGDVKDVGRAEAIVREVDSRLGGPVTVLVNNAGIRRDSPLALMPPGAWHDVIETNLTGTFNYSRCVIGAMMRSGGSILNITSVSGISGLPGQTNYSAAKAGVIGFTKALAREVARFGVRVNAIAPGFIESDMTASIDEKVRHKLYASIPLGAAGTPAHVAALAVFLASEDAAYITGQVYPVDGGLT
jgi:3-oxoacyl-[acyl-carrier protein] reductase